MSKPRAKRSMIHGLYTKMLTKDEKGEIAQISPTDIEGEITYLRAVCRRLAMNAEENGMKAGAVKPLSDVTLRTLNALDLKLNTLLRYIRTQAYLKGEPSEYDRQIEEGEFLARKRLNVFNYLSAGKKTTTGDGAGAVGDV